MANSVSACWGCPALWGSPSFSEAAIGASPLVKELLVHSLQAAGTKDPEMLFTKQERVGRGNFGEVYKGWVCHMTCTCMYVCLPI